MSVDRVTLNLLVQALTEQIRAVTSLTDLLTDSLRADGAPESPIHSGSDLPNISVDNPPPPKSTDESNRAAPSATSTEENTPTETTQEPSEETEISQEDLRKVFGALTKKIGREEGAKFFKSLGYKSLPAIPEAERADVLAKVKEALSNAE